jgi:hypothetical protein
MITGAVTGHADFDRKFQIVGDEAAARSVIRPELLDAHVAGSVPPWTARGHDLIPRRPGQLADPGALPTLLAPLIRVADLLDG